jgi:hypothetical protein
MPLQGFVGMRESLYAGDVGRMAGDGQRAVVADKGHFIGQIDPVLSDGDAA